jgi:hypothetical protein
MSQDSATRDNQPRSILQISSIDIYIGVVRKIHREPLGGVAQRKGNTIGIWLHWVHFWDIGREDCFAIGIVRSDVAMDLW